MRDGKLVYTSIVTKSWSEGEDLYGGWWTSSGYTVTIEYSEKLAPVETTQKDAEGNPVTRMIYTQSMIITAGDKTITLSFEQLKGTYSSSWASAMAASFTITTSGSGEDIFGNFTSTTQTLTMTVFHGKLITLGSSSKTTGEDILGNKTYSYSDTTYNYTMRDGKLVYTSIVTKSWSEGEDLYGGWWTSSGYTVTIEYSEKLAPVETTQKDAEGNPVTRMIYTQSMIITAGDKTITLSFEQLKGTYSSSWASAMAASFTITTSGSGEDIFGNFTSTTQTLTMTV